MYSISYGLFICSLALVLVFISNTESRYSSIVDYDEVSMYNSSYSITPISKQNITINVNNAQDSIGDPTYCSSSNSALCNLRSAFMYCNLYSDTITNTSCEIVLQSNSFLTFNTTYGTMSLNSTAFIVLLGNYLDHRHHRHHYHYHYHYNFF